MPRGIWAHHGHRKVKQWNGPSRFLLSACCGSHSLLSGNQCSQDALQFHVAAARLPWNHKLWSAQSGLNSTRPPEEIIASQMASKSGSLISETSIVIPGNNIQKKGIMIHCKGYIDIHVVWLSDQSHTHTHTHTHTHKKKKKNKNQRMVSSQDTPGGRNDYTNCKQKNTHASSLIHWFFNSWNITLELDALKERPMSMNKDGYPVASHLTIPHLKFWNISLGLHCIDEASSTCSTPLPLAFLYLECFCCGAASFSSRPCPQSFAGQDIPWGSVWVSQHLQFHSHLRGWWHFLHHLCSL